MNAHSNHTTALKPMECLKNVLPNVEQPDFQNIGLRYALEYRKVLLAFDTGTGKTFTYAMIVRALLNANPEGKHLFIIINDSIDQASSDLRDIVDAPISVFSAKGSSINNLPKEWNRSSIILLTYECFRSTGVMKFLYSKLSQIESIVIDEAHHISNWDSSNTAFMIRALTRTIPFVIGLSATPITREQEQFYRILNLLDRNLNFRKDESNLGKYTERYLPINREDYSIKGTYKVTRCMVQPTIDQVGKQHGIVFKNLKGRGAVNQVKCLCRLVHERLAQGKKIIIFIKYHETREWVEEHFKAASINYLSLHGKVKSKEAKTGIQRDFANDVAPVLITSITESLNMEADCVIFYEFTTQVKQMMGRAHRGLQPKKLEFIFIFTENTDEVEYFLKYIYARSITIQNILQKDYSELIKLGKELEDSSWC